MKDYAVLKSHRVLPINGDHEHLSNATTIAKAESRMHPRAEICVVRLVVCYRDGIETISNRRSYHYRKDT